MIAALGAALAGGLVNGAVVVGIGVDSFIATLGTGSVIQATTLALSNNEQIVGLPVPFGDISNNELLGLPLPVYYVLILAFSLAWYVLKHTPFGRYLYAIGSNREAARLAGIKTDRYTFVTACSCPPRSAPASRASSSLRAFRLRVA